MQPLPLRLLPKLKEAAAQADELSLDACVGTMQQIIWSKTGTEPFRQRLMMDGKQLLDGRKTLREEGAHEGSAVTVVTRTAKEALRELAEREEQRQAASEAEAKAQAMGELRRGFKAADFPWTTGLNGTPMKAYGAETTTEERWDLTHYVRSLGPPDKETRDENIVDIDFEVVWNINDPAKYLFNLRDPQMTIRAVAESAMREIIAQSDLAPILNRDRGLIAINLKELIQQTLDSYDSGVNVVRVNFDRADPPEQVIDAFRAVQAAEQERDRLEKQADAYANRVLAQARGESAQVLEEAEGYRARVVNEAKGEASRFSAVLAEYLKAPDVTRKRLYLETMEEVLGSVDKVIIDQQASGQGVVPYLPLNQLRQENK